MGGSHLGQGHWGGRPTREKLDGVVAQLIGTVGREKKLLGLEISGSQWDS